MGGQLGLEARLGGQMGWEGPNGTGKCKLQDAGGRAIGGCPRRMQSVWIGRACRNGRVQLQDPGASTTVVVSTGPARCRTPYLEPKRREGAIALTGQKTLERLSYAFTSSKPSSNSKRAVDNVPNLSSEHIFKLCKTTIYLVASICRNG